MRGRLIFPKLVEVARYDGPAVEAAGDFVRRGVRELQITNTNQPNATRVIQRRETPVRLKAQVETDAFQRITMGGLGQVPTSRLICVFFGPDLEQLGFVDPATKAPLLKPTDRLAGIYELNGTLIHQIDDPPGLYAIQVKPTGYGFGKGGYNLVEVLFEARPQGTVLAGGPGG